MDPISRRQMLAATAAGGLLTPITVVNARAAARSVSSSCLTCCDSVGCEKD